MKYILLIGFICISFLAFSQETLNQFDEQGKRHGLWKKTYEGQDQLKYEGTFNHGKEVGVFKHYKPNSGTQPTAIMTYKPNSDLVDVEYFTSKGKLISKGQMINRQRTGIWEYYHNDSNNVMMRETYENGKLSGLQTTYFDNGVVTDETNYVNGKRQGSYYLYSLKGVVLQHLQYDQDELHGLAIYYNGKGEKIIEGLYKRDRKDGYWKYYKDGKLVEEKFFPVNKSAKKN